MPETNPEILARSRTHLRIAWATLLVFATLGIALEVLHAFKVGAYLNVGNETRRWLWTLAHAHGLGLGLLHVAFAWTLRTAVETPSFSTTLASRLLTASTALIPLGFFLGGIVTYGSDPGVGIVLVPLGAAALWTSLLLICVKLR